MEKAIGEFKIVEAENGCRIEVKGNKEKVREMFSGLRWRKFRSRHSHPFGFGFGRGFWGETGPWCCWWEEEKEGSE